jgi:hypothetical protein
VGIAADGEHVPEQMDLVYPSCLDVPMMASFVAALEDGVASGLNVIQLRDS